MELPEQLVFMILTWLPVKSLLRFKSVCKSWYALIESSHFVNEHLFNNNNNNNNNNNCSSSLFSSSSIMIRNTSCWKRRYDHTEYVWLSGDKFENYIDTFHLNFFEELMELDISSSELTFTNSCNGIICLQFRDNVALWNPAIDQFRPLPLPPTSPLTSSSRFNSTINTLLGFDIRTKDYKVVMIVRFKGDKPLSSVNKPDSQVLVYNLSTDSWTTIYTDLLLPFEIFCYRDSKLVYKNGICFWIGTNTTPTVICGWEDVLVSFDFSTEVIRTIPMPLSDTNQSVGTYALDFLNENIVCINVLTKKKPIVQGAMYERNPRVNQLVEIWMLHGYGVKESWTKLYTLGPFPIPNIFPRRCSKNGDFLLLSTRRDNLSLYNIVTQEMQDIYGSFRELVFYNESLVSIKGVNAAANTKTCLFANMSRYGYGSEEVEDETEEKSNEGEEVEEDIEKIISNELDVGLKLEFEPSSSK